MSAVVVEHVGARTEYQPRSEPVAAKRLQGKPRDAVMMFAWSIENEKVVVERPCDPRKAECPPETYIG